MHYGITFFFFLAYGEVAIKFYLKTNFEILWDSKYYTTINYIYAGFL